MKRLLQLLICPLFAWQVLLQGVLFPATEEVIYVCREFSIDSPALGTTITQLTQFVGTAFQKYSI